MLIVFSFCPWRCGLDTQFNRFRWHGKPDLHINRWMTRNLAWFFKKSFDDNICILWFAPKNQKKKPVLNFWMTKGASACPMYTKHRSALSSSSLVNVVVMRSSFSVSQMLSSLSLSSSSSSLVKVKSMKIGSFDLSKPSSFPSSFSSSLIVGSDFTLYIHYEYLWELTMKSNPFSVADLPVDCFSNLEFWVVPLRILQTQLCWPCRYLSHNVNIVK